jgi:hypothetical protein
MFTRKKEQSPVPRGPKSFFPRGVRKMTTTVDNRTVTTRPAYSFPTFKKIKSHLDGLGIKMPENELLPETITDATVGLFTTSGIFTGLCIVSPSNIQSIGGKLRSDTILISDDADKLMFKLLIKTGEPKDVEWNTYPDMTERKLSTNRQVIKNDSPRIRNFSPKPELGSRVLIQVMDGQGSIVSEHYNRVLHKESLTLFRGIEQFYPQFLIANPTYVIHETYIDVDPQLDGLACELIQACTNIARVDPSENPNRTSWGQWVRIYIDNLIIYPWMWCVPRKSFSPIVILKQFTSPSANYIVQLSQTINIAIKIAKQFLDPLHDIVTAFELLKVLISDSGPLMLETVVTLDNMKLETIRKQQEISKKQQEMEINMKYIAEIQQNLDSKSGPTPLLKARMNKIIQLVETKQKELIHLQGELIPLQEKLDTEQNRFNDTIKSSDHDIDVDEYADDFENLKGVSIQELDLDSPLKGVSTQGLSLDSPLEGVSKESKYPNFMLFLSELDAPTSKALGLDERNRISSPENFTLFLSEVSKYNRIPAQDMFRGTATVNDVANELKGSKFGGRKTRRVKRTRKRKLYKRKSRR